MFGRQKSINHPSKSDYYGLSYIVMERPGRTKILNAQSESTSQDSYNYHILYTFAHAFEMQMKDKLSKKEWDSWLNLIRTTFTSQSISEAWTKDSDLREWFDPQFSSFISKEIMPLSVTT